jgi:ABC-type branched-subunit amino acid transport system permease subunit
LEENKEMKDRLASKTKIIGLILAFLLLAVLPPLYTSYWITLFTQMLIYGILAMSLDILLGYTGLSSFGHAGFFGAAGYVVAILSTRYKMGFLICFVSGHHSGARNDPLGPCLQVGLHDRRR